VVVSEVTSPSAAEAEAQADTSAEPKPTSVKPQADTSVKPQASSNTTWECDGTHGCIAGEGPQVQMLRKIARIGMIVSCVLVVAGILPDSMTMLSKSSAIAFLICGAVGAFSSLMAFVGAEAAVSANRQSPD